MDILTIALFIVLFMLSAFFSGTELALMSTQSHTIEALVREKRFGAAALKHIKENNDRLLITILIGNNLVNVYAAALATQIAISMATASGLPQAQAVGIATGVITFLLLLFGEIIPKSLATKNATAISCIVAPIYRFIMTVLYPVILVMEVIIRLFARGKKVHKMTEGEFESFIDLGKDTGTLEHDEHEKIMNILEFGDITAEEIMTPRVKIEAISMETTVKEAMEYYLSHTHSRIPIYDGMIDKIDYFITARDIIFAFKRGELEKKMSDLKLKTVIKIPLNQPISKVMETFQNAHKVMGIVLDEYGGVAGLVTMEDILEEVFGEIRDETDKEVDEIQESSENTYTVDPWVLIEDILDEMELELEDIGLDEKEFDGETVSYIITHELERFPEAGEVVVFAMKEGGKIEFKVTTVEDGKIGMIEVKKLES